MRKNVPRFIASATLVERRNQLPEEELSARQRAIEARFPNGLTMDRQHEWLPLRWERCHNYTLRVVVTDARWAQHLERGLSFSTVGYDAWVE